MSPVDPSAREEFLAKVASTYGEEHIITGDSIPYVARIPFRSPMLTWATTGGVPIGQISRWYGIEGSGKSLTNLGVIWAAQNFPQVVEEFYEVDIKQAEKSKNKLRSNKLKKEMKSMIDRFPDGMETVIYDTEQRVDKRLAELMGVDMSRVDIFDSNIVEEVCDTLSEGFKSAHLHIIDSASNCQSLDEAGLDVGDQLRASAPRAWTQWLKQARKHMDRRENTLIIVDQVRTQLGMQSFKGNTPLEPPNIRYIKHNASLAIEFAKGKKLYRSKSGLLTDDYNKADNNLKSLGTDGKEPHGLQMGCHIVKNSTGRPFRNARMRFSFPVRDIKTGELAFPIGFDQAFELLEIAIYFGIVEVSGSWYYLLDNKFNRTKTKWQGELKAREAIESDESLRKRIIAALHRDM